MAHPLGFPVVGQAEQLLDLDGNLRGTLRRLVGPGAAKLYEC